MGFIGVPQPLSDALKLLTKETPALMKPTLLLFILTPIMATLIIFIIWSLYIRASGVVVLKLGILFFITVSSLNVYTTILSGWASNSKYALLGAIRAIAQTISYEIRMAIIIITVLILRLRFNLEKIYLRQNIWYIYVLPLIFFIWIITCLAETNRAPFDLAEGESELVSGFNIEYGRGEFALLFIAEYGRILFISILTSCLFVSNFYQTISLLRVFKTLIFAFIFLWVRGTYPRIRYDKLISLTWKRFLSVSLVILILLLNYV